jgi:hypothetical protein
MRPGRFAWWLRRFARMCLLFVVLAAIAAAVIHGTALLVVDLVLLALPPPPHITGRALTKTGGHRSDPRLTDPWVSRPALEDASAVGSRIGQYSRELLACRIACGAWSVRVIINWSSLIRSTAFYIR